MYYGVDPRPSWNVLFALESHCSSARPLSSWNYSATMHVLPPIPPDVTCIWCIFIFVFLITPWSKFVCADLRAVKRPVLSLASHAVCITEDGYYVNNLQESIEVTTGRGLTFGYDYFGNFGLSLLLSWADLGHVLIHGNPQPSWAHHALGIANPWLKHHSCVSRSQVDPSGTHKLVWLTWCSVTLTRESWKSWTCSRDMWMKPNESARKIAMWQWNAHFHPQTLYNLTVCQSTQLLPVSPAEVYHVSSHNWRFLANDSEVESLVQLDM